jgi:hypothetical protein
LLKISTMAMLLTIVSTCRSKPTIIYNYKDCQFAHLIPIHKENNSNTNKEIEKLNIKICHYCDRYKGTIACQKILNQYEEDKERLEF